MRISDWSSDVCSSDLGGVRGALLNEMLRGANTRGQGPGRQARAIERAAWIEIGAGKPQRGRDIAEEVEKVGSVVGDDLVAAVKGAEHRLERPPVIIQYRKSVVYGKRVSVRVYRVGSLSIKKNIT